MGSQAKVVVAREPVQDVFAQPVPGWESRMREVPGDVALHAETFHDRARAAVGRNRERNDLVEIEFFESEGKGCASRFRRVTVAPMLLG